MKSQDSDTATGESEETEPEKQATEQTQSESKPIKSFQDILIEGAAEEGYEIGTPQPKAEEETKPDDKSSETIEGNDTGSESDAVTTETEEKPREDKEEESGEELKPAAEKKGDEWPDSAKVRVAEETAKRKRAIDRADKAEALAQQLQQQLAQAVAPQPTSDNPFIDVQDIGRLDHFKNEYEKTIDMAEENPEALVEQIVEAEKKRTGVDLLEKLTPEQIVSLAKRKAEKAIRTQIPERRTYLEQRAVNDAQALEVYPELRNPETDLTKVTAYFMHQVLTGKAQNDPTLLVYCGHAAKQYLASQQRNGKETPEVKSSDAKKILDSSRQKVAPTPTKTRSFTEPRRSSSDLAKAKKLLQERGDDEAAEAYIAAVFAQRERANKLEPIPE